MCWLAPGSVVLLHFRYSWKFPHWLSGFLAKRDFINFSLDLLSIENSLLKFDCEIQDEILPLEIFCSSAMLHEQIFQWTEETQSLKLSSSFLVALTFDVTDKLFCRKISAGLWKGGVLSSSVGQKCMSWFWSLSLIRFGLPKRTGMRYVYEFLFL